MAAGTAGNSRLMASEHKLKVGLNPARIRSIVGW